MKKNFVDNNNLKLYLSNLEKIKYLPSMTTIDERMGLVNLVLYKYKNKGHIWDLGTAAGGSTFCLALGLSQRVDILEKNLIGFDSFQKNIFNFFKDHETVKAFKEKEKSTSAIDLFKFVTKEFDFIKSIEIDFNHNISHLNKKNSVEIVHLDVAKSLNIWKNLIPVILTNLIENGTLIFQDFFRIRLPWQWMFVGYSLKNNLGYIDSIYKNGVVHFVLTKNIPTKFVEKVTTFNLQPEEINSYVSEIMDFLIKNNQYIDKFEDDISNLYYGILSYSYEYIGDYKKTKKYVKKISNDFFNKKNNFVFAKELDKYF